MQTSDVIFIFGRHPSLSLLELFQVLTAEQLSFAIISVSRECARITVPKDALHLLHSRLGGIIKIGILSESEFSLHPLQDDPSLLLPLLKNSFTDTEKRFTFGLSAYTLTRASQKQNLGAKTLQRIGLELKKELRREGFSVRFVAADGTTLSSVQVEKNGLTEQNGCELLLIESDGKLRIGATLCVQEFEEYSFRDWQRPHRSMVTGLLPPKLARMMINATGLSPRANPSLADPFCGLGTVLQEASLLGFQSVRGSDIDTENVQAAQENLAWLAREKKIAFSSTSIVVCDAQKLSIHYEPGSLDAIITEPYLGPIFSKEPRDLSKTIQELSGLYATFYREARTVLKKSGRIVAVWPAWQLRHSLSYLPILDTIISLGYRNITIPNALDPFLKDRTERNTLRYFRPGQIVTRELIVLEKK